MIYTLMMILTCKYLRKETIVRPDNLTAHSINHRRQEARGHQNTKVLDVAPCYHLHNFITFASVMSMAFCRLCYDKVVRSSLRRFCSTGDGKLIELVVSSLRVDNVAASALSLSRR